MRYVLAISVLLWSTAYAQGDQVGEGLIASTGAWVTLLLLAEAGSATTALGVYYTTKDDKQAARYLRENEHNILQALATGEGVFLDDMMVVFQVPPAERAPFVAALSARYLELTALAAPKRLTEARAAAFFDLIAHIRQGT